jgi:hypothetical protein
MDTELVHSTTSSLKENRGKNTASLVFQITHSHKEQHTWASWWLFQEFVGEKNQD